MNLSYRIGQRLVNSIVRMSASWMFSSFWCSSWWPPWGAGPGRPSSWCWTWPTPRRSPCLGWEMVSTIAHIIISACETLCITATSDSLCLYSQQNWNWHLMEKLIDAWELALGSYLKTCLENDVIGIACSGWSFTRVGYVLFGFFLYFSEFGLFLLVWFRFILNYSLDGTKQLFCLYIWQF